jgi:hypothetical protein
LRRTRQTAPLTHNVETATGRFENEPNTDTEADEHIDERVSAEQVEPASKKVTYPRLGHTENLCHLGLPEVSRRNKFLDLDHQVGSDEQVLGLIGAKAQIPKDIAA